MEADYQEKLPKNHTIVTLKETFKQLQSQTHAIERNQVFSYNPWDMSNVCLNVQ